MAAGDAADQGIAHAGEHGQAGEQGIVGGGVRAIGVGVEEQVGGGIARDMGLHIDPGGEDQARRIDAGGMGFAAQIVLRLDAGLEQPQHASGHRGEQAHPQREHVGQDLVGVVEATEHEAGLGRPQAARVGGGPGGRRVVSLGKAMCGMYSGRSL